MKSLAVQHFQDKLVFEIDPSDLYDALKENASIVVVDARQPFKYEAEHIPGSINFPHRTMNAESTKTLDKTALYVVYCDGVGCNASTKGCLNLARLGFEVKEMIGGLEYWKVDGFPTDGVARADVKAVHCGC